MRIRDALLAVVILLAGALGVVGPAHGAMPAHTAMIASTPADGAKIPHAPAVVILTFSEDVNPSFVTVAVSGPVSDATGGKAGVEGDTVTQPLLADLPVGRYQVKYRVVSADGHPVAGAINFTVTQGMSIETTIATPEPSGPESDSAAPSVTPSGSASPDGAVTNRESPWTTGRFVLIGALAAAGAAGLAALLRRRRVSSRED